MMMENVNYGREELLVLNMVQKGVFGELIHGEAAYIHDLRSQMHEIEHAQRRPCFVCLARDGLHQQRHLGWVGQGEVQVQAMTDLIGCLKSSGGGWV